MGKQNKTNRCIKIYLIAQILLSVKIASGLSPQEVFQKVIEKMYPQNATYMVEMYIYRKNIDYVKEFKICRKGEDKSMVEFLNPPKERGIRILSKGDSTWMYLPSVERIIRLSGSISFSGSDFIHEDILKVRLDKDYKVVSLKEDKDCFLLELEPKRKKVLYNKIIYFVNKDYLPVKTEFYGLNNQLLKTLTYKEFKLIKETLIPSSLIMENAFTQDYRTILKIKDVSFNVIPDRIFTQEYLSKGL